MVFHFVPLLMCDKKSVVDLIEKYKKSVSLQAKLLFGVLKRQRERIYDIREKRRTLPQPTKPDREIYRQGDKNAPAFRHVGRNGFYTNETDALANYLAPFLGLSRGRCVGIEAYTRRIMHALGL